MKKGKGFFYWFPRIAGIVFILFISMFALDIFGNGYTFWQTVVGLFMHLIPSFVLAIVLIISRKYDLIGAIAFTLAGLAYIIVTLGKVEWYIAISWSLIIAGPAICIGICFLVRRLHLRKKVVY
ncbi:MAG: hypothetical protein WC606_03040 [Candidatus Absconditabacterales bacterium]